MTYRLLLDEGIDPNELTSEDLKSLLKAEAYESFIVVGAKIFWHRDKEYVIGKDISLEMAQAVCLAQWVDRDDRLQFAHALFEKYLEEMKMHPDLELSLPTGGNGHWVTLPVGFTGAKDSDG